jgi:hypothetical protein
VPEGQVALASEEIGTEDATVVAEPWHLSRTWRCRQIR